MPLNLSDSIQGVNGSSATTTGSDKNQGTDKWKNPNRAKAEAGGWKSSGCEIM
jgi:hypothetical protein